MNHLLILFAASALLLAQTQTTPAQFRKVDPHFTHERIIAIVPMVGAGTAKDPKRPLFSDLPGITGFTAELSDDGRTALVEFVAKDRSQLNGLVNSGQRLERKDSPGKDAILQEFKTYKRNFKPDRFGLAIP